ncbi:unnamed protein product [Rotaria magnacalcarata]|uniref:Beta-lactamase-related domain-containing protein n=1 Tax=Rotaria magnacalcarata TaxID=392030 RepID=A0A819XKE9_9BILA|nr:unnamed protein product [Rotaria magnacalcarata]CAF4142050.1 unnamed protein product [Rotaria magnacalcarata]
MACFLLFELLVISLVGVRSVSNCPDRQSIEESLSKVHVPGAAIIVVNATDVLYEQAFGYQSLSRKQSIDIDKSIFTLASVSKTFIGVAVMQLVEKELVDLDTDINQYLSEPARRIFHPQYPSHSITLRKLISHTASIYSNITSLTDFILLNDTVFTSQTALADMCFTYLNPNSSNWLPKPPGSVYLYSNEGSSLAALVVERIAKIPYDQYIKEYILKPLNIDVRKTGFRLADFENREELVEHYVYVSNQSFLPLWNKELPHFNITQIAECLPTWLHIPFFSIKAFPAGLLRISTGSLSLFLRMIINNGSSILTPRSVAEMRRVVGDGLIPQYTENSIGNSTDVSMMPTAGLGWFWHTMSDGHQYFGHNGGLPGVANLMLINEKNNIGVIVLTNGDILQPIDLSAEIYATIIDIHKKMFQCFDINTTNSIVF